ncbi:MAG: tetratricopeptide repeat protein, partial [Planctomycetota bacterium]
LLEKVDTASIWGEESSKDFPEILAGFRGLQRGDPEKAVEGLTRALGMVEMAWLEEEILFARAKLLYRAKRFDESVEDLKVLAARFPREPEIFLTLGHVLTGKACEEEARGNNPIDLYNKGIEAYKKILEVKPDHKLADESIGTAYMGLGKAQEGRGLNPIPAFEKAVEHIDRGLPLSPTRVTSLINRGIANQELGDAIVKTGGDGTSHFEKALADFEKALSLDPERASPHHALGAYYGAAGIRNILADRDPTVHLTKATEYLLKARELDSDHHSADYNLGLLFLHLGDAAWDREEDPTPLYRKAEGFLGNTLKGDPRHSDALCARSTVYRMIAGWEKSQGKDARPLYRKAIQEIQEALKINPNRTRFLSNLGLAFRGLGASEGIYGGDPFPWFSRAIEWIDRALAINPKIWRGYRERGRLLERLNRYEEAAEDFEKAITLARGGDPDLKDHLHRAKSIAALPRWKRLAYYASTLQLYEKAYAACLPFFEESIVEAKKAGAGDVEEDRIHIAASHYNIACIHALASIGKPGPEVEGKSIPPEEAAKHRRIALEHFEKALALGSRDFDHIKKDTDLDPIRDDPAFRALIEKWKAVEDGAKKNGKDKDGKEQD